MVPLDSLLFSQVLAGDINDSNEIKEFSRLSNKYIIKVTYKNLSCNAKRSKPTFSKFINNCMNLFLEIFLAVA